MTALYAVTLFVSAALLFVVQPMFARALLPRLGGSPAVWNTAMVFYQAALLGGYAWAHWSTRRLGVRRQAAWHLLLLLLPVVVLPVELPAGWFPATDRNPIPGLLVVMATSVGLPFFVLACTSPLLQRWFAASGRAGSSDPYFLFAASNAGSLFGLLSYPLAVERWLAFPEQARGWAVGYALLAVLTLACAVGLWQSRPAVPLPVAPSTAARMPKARRARWVLLSFAPSSLMLGVTTYFSSEVAVVPLLWIVPLLLYLVTFIIAFARPRADLTWIRRGYPMLFVALLLVLAMMATQPLSGILLLHLGVFFFGSLLCHARLAADRPGAEHLTEYYLWLSLGGVLGGVFNALVAPLLFDSIAEYPVVLVLTAWLALGGANASPASRRDWIWPVLLGAAALAATRLLAPADLSANVTANALVFGAAAIGCYLFSHRPIRFTAGAAALLLAARLAPGEEGRQLYAERSFFGIHRVTLDPTGRYHQLIHGSTLHGRQSVEPERRHEPLTYYHPSGPAGDLFAGDPTPGRIAVVGLGTGSLIAYAQPGQHWTFFEIDPVVVRLARDSRYLSFLDHAAVRPTIVVGDARASLGSEPDAAFDLLVLDAYSSDAIPMHLATREALALYLRKLRPGGRLAIHISNVYLDLEPAFGNLAHDAGLVSFTRNDTALSPAEIAAGKSPSVWLVMAPTARELGAIPHDPRWQPTRRHGRIGVWTDAHSSILPIVRWE